MALDRVRYYTKRVGELERMLESSREALDSLRTQVDQQEADLEAFKAMLDAEMSKQGLSKEQIERELTPSEPGAAQAPTAEPGAAATGAVGHRDAVRAVVSANPGLEAGQIFRALQARGHRINRQRTYSTLSRMTQSGQLARRDGRYYVPARFPREPGERAQNAA